MPNKGENHMLSMLRLDLAYCIRAELLLKMTVFSFVMVGFNMHQINTHEDTTFLDLILYIFGGLPSNGLVTLWDILRLVLIYLFPSYLAGEVFSRNVTQNKLSVLIRVKSKISFLISKIIVLLVLVFLYLMISWMICWVGSMIFMKSTDRFSSEFMNIYHIQVASFSLIHTFLLTLLGIWMTLLIMLIAYMGVDKFAHAFVGVIVVLFLSVTWILYSNKLAGYWWFTRSMAFRHLSLADGSANLHLLNSYLYLISCLAVTTIVIIVIFRRKDIF